MLRALVPAVKRSRQLEAFRPYVLADHSEREWVAESGGAGVRAGRRQDGGGGRWEGVMGLERTPPPPSPGELQGPPRRLGFSQAVKGLPGKKS